MTDDPTLKINVFWMDARRYESTETALTGAQIKAAGNCSPGYQLFLEEEDNKPDRGICDGEAIRIDGRVLHFWAAPLATMFG